jgi:maltose O-acetyltransferase
MIRQAKTAVADILTKISFASKGYWLDHMFIEPFSIGKGNGVKMFVHLRDRCGVRGVSELGILADPHSRGFYEKMGCDYMCEYPSTIKNRTTPYLKLKIGSC